MAFGYSALGSIDALLAGRTTGQGSGLDFGDTHMYGVVLYQLIVTPVLLAILYVGGWRVRDLKVAPSVSGTVLGALIFAGMWLGDWAFTLLMKIVFPAMRSLYDMWEAYRPSEAPTLFAIVVLSLVNPVFRGGLRLRLCDRSPPRALGTTTAVNVSVVIRASYHLYQGLAWQPFHIAYGLVQAYVYVRYERLWPLLVSHALLDLVALAYYLV